MHSHNTIKLIIFDLDGVLVDSRPLHYEALNSALEEIDEKYIITHDEHIAKYDGNSTSNKLKMLTKDKNLPENLYNLIWKLKQEKTITLIKNFVKDDRLCELLSNLKNRGYLLYCASNSIWNTIKMMLIYKGFLQYFDFFISNEEVRNHKPSPEIYLKCIQRSKLKPSECLILEDSPIGKEAAMSSGCNLCPIIDPSDVTLDKILKYIDIFESNNAIKQISHKWIGNINIVIPMAGFGSRFAKAGYTFPKPLIDINGKPMIQLVVENLNIEGNYIFIVQREHYSKYCLKYLLNLIAPNCIIICIDNVTDGAARSVLLAEKYIDNNSPLLIANSDQYVDWSSSEFLYNMANELVDGGISTFESLHPKWSYVHLDNNGFVDQVKEKEVISNKATTGIYHWSKGSDFVKYAKQMIEKNIRVNNEFYVAPVYNQAIADGKKFKIKDCTSMHGLGTPEDLNLFLLKICKEDNQLEKLKNSSMYGDI